MAKAVITEVTIWNEAYEAKYYSGATKSGNIGEMPKTVKTWIEKNPEKVNDYRTEAAEVAEEPEAKNLVDLVLELEALKSKPALTDEEIRLMPYGAKNMTLECGMRFLTDYLQGDTYFMIHREGHNLDRAHTQIALVRDMERKWSEMEEIVAKCAGKS